MVVVKELHDVEEEEERLAQLAAGTVSLVPVSFSNGDGEGLESFSVRVRWGGGRGNVTQLLIQQFQNFAVVL